MSIRKATYSETQKILGHSLEVLKEATMGYVDPVPDKVQQMVAPFLLDGGYYLVDCHNNVIQGWIGVGRTTDYYTDEMVMFIPEIYVLPQYRNQGVAEKLCKEVVRHLKDEGYKKIQLNVFSGNHVKHLYQKLGFQEVSTLMELKLDGDSS
ncbi:GNAT family N-acetyltransferase [Halobacillus amylolyticus]|uniref:GNAT family N-acetyltransferase n=1 Tax=Halobacillus amylolyticus TaxID=2932259 RepID=A0ABY4HGJ8_9BACI|nr:GNAT family N-acetyltransferase [Halobacillus amylolyticus]UOR13498.1 GNAT family N-acetyltransferase [Halobacillus amylolyticus]